MLRAYSQDLRDRVIQAVEGGCPPMGVMVVQARQYALPTDRLNQLRRDLPLELLRTGPQVHRGVEPADQIS